MELSVPLPKTPDGKANQRCPDNECHPGKFQIGSAPQERPAGALKRMCRTPGPGETICPYCGTMARDREFIDPEDVEVAKREIAWAARRDVADAFKEIALAFNRRTPSGGFVSLRMEVNERYCPHPMAWREDLLRDLVCQLCARRYGVYAIALFCPDCGGPNFATHFAREVELVTKQTDLAEQLREEGKRELAYRLLGNAHEDVLTAFETYLKTAYRFLMKDLHEAEGEAKKMRFGGNWFQNVNRAQRAFAELGVHPFEGLSEDDLAFLRVNIEKRHVVGHNLSVADETYVEATQEEHPGCTVRLLREEILRFAGVCAEVIRRLDGRLAPGVSRG